MKTQYQLIIMKKKLTSIGLVFSQYYENNSLLLNIILFYNLIIELEIKTHVACKILNNYTYA